MDRGNAKRQLRRLRERRGWSWTDEARAIASAAKSLGIERVAGTHVTSIRRTIARWESDTSSSPVPDDRYQWVLAHVYAERNGQTDIGPGSEFQQLLSVLSNLGTSPERVAEIRDAVIDRIEREGSSPFPLLHGKRPDGDSVDELETAFSAVRSRIGKVPFSRSQITLAPLVAAVRHLDAKRTLPDTARTLAVRVFATAGRLAFELHDDRAAEHHYADALAHARRLPDPWLLASVHTSLTMIALHGRGDPGEAERRANASVRAAMDGSSLSVRARALAVQAEVTARRGLERPATDALELAHTYAAGVSPNDPAGQWSPAGRLDGFVGLCQLLAGNSRGATDVLHRAADGIPETVDPVQRSIVLADLAAARLGRASPDPEASVAALRECAGLVGRTRGRVALGRVAQVRRALRPWNGEQFVIEFDEYLYESVLR